MSTKEILAIWAERFRDAGVDSPGLSAQLLLVHVLQCDRLDLIVHHDRNVSDCEYALFEELARRRANGEPVAYLVGTKEFYGIEFSVTKDVLIPRPETEFIVEYVIQNYSGNKEFVVLDIGTGSGAIAISLALSLPRVRVVATDLSIPALKIARYNIENHGLKNRVDLVCADLVSALSMRHFDLIAANLPYVPLRACDIISHEVLNFEPHLALFGGCDGTSEYSRLFEMICSNKYSGRLICECDLGHVNFLANHVASLGKAVSVHKDMTGRDRFLDVVF